MKMCPVKQPVLAGCWHFVALLFFLTSLFAASAQDGAAKIARIDIKPIGPATVSEQLVRANLRVKAGDVFSRNSADDDVTSLYATGLFSNIRVAAEDSSEGLVLTYLVQAKARITEIKFTGNKKFKNEKLLKKISSKVGEPLDERKLFTDCQDLKKMYEKAGYHGTEVTFINNIEESAGRGSATFEVKEQPKVRIKSVEIEGISAFPEKKLRKVIKTRGHWMFSWLTGSGVYKADQIEEDREKLTSFYREEGYIDFEIKKLTIEQLTSKKIRVHLEVSEGTPYKVGAVTFKGTTLLPTNAVRQDFQAGPMPAKGTNRTEWIEQRRLHRNFNMKEGDTFTPGGLSRDSSAIEDYYGAKGYIDVTPGPGLRVAKIPNTEKSTMDLEYTIDEGSKAYIEKIEIHGNTKTKDRVIRRELAVAPGEVFDMVRVKLSKDRLEGLEFFGKVETKPDPTVIPNRKNLVIGVEEKDTGKLSFSAGYSTVEQVIGFVEFTQGNFDLANPPHFIGAGQKFRTRLQLGSRQKSLEVSFVEPWFAGRKLSLGVDLYHRELSYQSLEGLYDEQRTGAKFSLSRALGSDFLIGSLYYNIEDVGILNVSTNAPASITAESGHALLSTVGASIAVDTRNKGYSLPDKGQRTELFGEFTGGPLGGDKEFYKLEVKSAWYFKGFLPGDVLELTGQAGVADSLKNGQDVPFYDRFYLGGVYSLRGFRYREVGPREPILNSTAFEPVGGNTYWFASAEYSTPIMKQLRFAVFYDIGMVYPGAFSFSPEPTRGAGYDTGAYADNYGLGIRLNIPGLGPLRLDYGIPLTTPPGLDSGGRIQVSAGHTRTF